MGIVLRTASWLDQVEDVVRPSEAGAVTEPPCTEFRTSLEQLQRYLVEIIMYTVSANPLAIRKALGEPARNVCTYDAPERHSILDEKEKKDLYYLAGTVWKSNQCFMTDRSEYVLDYHRDLMRRAIIEPAAELGLDTDFVLDLISSYFE